MRYQKKIINKRIRSIKGSFAWIDHRVITGGFLDDLSCYEILLYFFLVAVSDRNGLSFYHDDRICRLLKIDLFSLGKAREMLVHRSLIDYKAPLYQVLDLPARPVVPPSVQELEQEKRKRDLSYIQRIKETVMRR